jgi:hypothetical protein
LPASGSIAAGTRPVKQLFRKKRAAVRLTSGCASRVPGRQTAPAFRRIARWAGYRRFVTHRGGTKREGASGTDQRRLCTAR